MGIDDITYFPAEGPRPVGWVAPAQQERNELAEKMEELIPWLDLIDVFAVEQGAAQFANPEMQDDIRRVAALLRGES